MSFLCFYQPSIVCLKAEHEISQKIYYIARGLSTCLVMVHFWIVCALSHLCPVMVPPFQSCEWALKMRPVSAVFWWNSINWCRLTSTQYFQKVSLCCMPMQCSRNSVHPQGAEGIKGHANIANISVMPHRWWWGRVGFLISSYHTSLLISWAHFLINFRVC